MGIRRFAKSHTAFAKGMLGLVDATILVVVICALVLVGLRMVRYFWPVSPAFVSNWTDYEEGGHRIGSAQGQVTIIMFSDFTCSYCLNVFNGLERLRSELGDNLTIVYQHFLSNPSDETAITIARASECAAQLGKFESFYRIAFQHREIIFSRDWAGLVALSADFDPLEIAEIQNCIDRGDGFAAVRASHTAAEKLGLRGTPSFLIEGWLVEGYDDVDNLYQLATTRRLR